MDVLRQGHSQFVISSVAYKPLILGSMYPLDDFSCVAIVGADFHVLSSNCQQNYQFLAIYIKFYLWTY